MRNNDKKPSIVFYGSDEIGKIVFDALKEAGFVIVDKPPADLGVVASYGKILSQKTLSKFPHGVLNIHPSLLPRYRGPSPIRTAIANGDTETGVTIIKLNEKMDEGDVVAQNVYRITQNVMHTELRNQLAKLGAELLIKIIPDYMEGKIEPKKQDYSLATYTKLITREDGKVDLENDAPETIFNKFRAYEGWPGIWFMHSGKRVKIINCKIENCKLKIISLQPEGKKPMSMLDYINGHGKLPNS